MRAMVAHGPGEALRLEERPRPVPGPGRVLVKVSACGICRTDLHVVDGELDQTRYPVVPGHEIVGTVAELGAGVATLSPGERVGVPWLGSTCGSCRYCTAGQENLCDYAHFNGCDLDGGYQEYMVADARYCFSPPTRFSDMEAAPLLCAGLIGHRAHRMVTTAERLGIYGFGAAAHIMAQVARHQGQAVYAFTRPGDRETQDFALSLGARWAGGSDEAPPDPLDAAVIFASVGELIPTALRTVRKAGVVVAAGIHMSDIPAFPYDILWGERVIRSVANLTRADGEDFMSVAESASIKVHVSPYPLEAANAALEDLRRGRVNGAAVLAM